jgi:hypothetical protein
VLTALWIALFGFPYGPLEYTPFADAYLKHINQAIGAPGPHLAIDCNADDPGLQETCIYSNNVAGIAVSVIYQNNSGVSSIRSFHLSVRNPDPARLSVVSVNDPGGLNGSPDFDETGVGTAGAWQCASPPPVADNGEEIGAERSEIGCAAPSGPDTAPLQDITLASVAYDYHGGNGMVRMTLPEGRILDNDGIELLNCEGTDDAPGPPGDDGQCFWTDITFVDPAPDLVVSDIEVEPDNQCRLMGDVYTAHVTITNIGGAAAGASTLRVGNQFIGMSTIDARGSATVTVTGLAFGFGVFADWEFDVAETYEQNNDSGYGPERFHFCTFTPTATPVTPTATPTPTIPGPHVLKVPEGNDANTDPSIPAANLWLCISGPCSGPGEGNLIVFEYATGVSTGDQNGDSITDGLGAYEFSVEYDNFVIQSVNPQDAVFAPLGSLNPHPNGADGVPDGEGAARAPANCTFSLILENVVHFGCTTSGPLPPGPTGDFDLARLNLVPHPDLANDIFPGNDNGVVTVLKDNGCELVDVFGHPVSGSVAGGLTPVCGDLAVTVRILEGDLNLDCAVDVEDQQQIAFRYGSFFGSALYSQWFDLEPNLHDLDVDIKDIQKVFGRDGSTCQSPLPAQPPLPPPAPFGN